MSAKIDLRHLDFLNSDCYIKAEAARVEDQNTIVVTGFSEFGTFHDFQIVLDISTAIRLSKTLRTEINKAKEVNNG